MKTATGGEHFTLNYDNNGNMKNLPVNDTNSLVYNWDNKLRSAQKGSNTISLKYDPAGNRIYKNSSSVGQRKYIVDVAGDLPVILMEINPSDSIVKKTYIYANSQIIAQHDGNHSANRYFYLYDRLGSVRVVIDSSGVIKNHYTYNPFGELFTTETTETITNPFKFTGQYYDFETGEYCFRARQYNPHIYRFTTTDPVSGQFDNPLSLHKYLYCQNEPINRIDPMGLLYLVPNAGKSYSWEETQQVINAAVHLVGTDFIYGPLKAFGRLGEDGIGDFDYKMYNELYGGRLNFEIRSGERLLDSEFGNYLAGYTLFYNYRAPGLFASWGAGHYYGLAEWYQYRSGVSERYIRWPFDDFSSQYWDARGCRDANREAYSGLGAKLDDILLGAAVWNLDILRTLDYFQYSEGAFE